MSPQTTGAGQSGSRKPPLRLQIPVDNPDVEAFLAAQGTRNQSQAVVMLIRMWVNEFGPTSVMEQTMVATTLSRLKQDSVAQPAPVATAPEQDSEPDAEPASVPVPPPAPEPAPVATPEPPIEALPAPPAAPRDDIEDLFRK
ncbi:hypothetical protein CA951_03465 [Rhodococcus sp. NCIMB 12038]|nr:hypothetical protein CA951_03465 [Rhodococcus sp. NCIMB 12038]